ncbi:MAG: DEAD/DEAH box helicase [Cyclobacteriaceae bacterium]|nr:DEAD/DEAH box helicase [Cyclobacteriaceae bacterium]
MQVDFNVRYASYLKNLSIEELNAMQIAVLQKVSTINNIMVLSPTGSGKTLPFLLACLSRFNVEVNAVQAIIVTPSRELALQIEQVFKTMKTSFKVSCCYGGHSFKTEQDSLSGAPALLIATPGRLADHISRKSFDSSQVQLVVLDEFDKSLQMGFHDQIRLLFKTLKGKQQHILTSATKLEALPDFLPFKKAEIINFLNEEGSTNLQLKLVRTSSADKVEMLLRLVAGFNQEVCLVFCNHREAVDRISKLFAAHKFEHGILHGAMEQIDREKNLIKYRGGAHNVLIATDLASRGLDIPEIRHVVHYQLPTSEESFTHRNGRTARMHASGEAYLVLADDETLPKYITDKPKEITLPERLQLPPPPAFVCLYISAGKKDKISKGDIAGLLMKKVGLKQNEIGLITTLDYSSYVLVSRLVVNQVLAKTRDERIKKVKVRIEIAN